MAASRISTFGLALHCLFLSSLAAAALFNLTFTRQLPLPGIELPCRLVSCDPAVTASEETGCNRRTPRAAAVDNAHEQMEEDEGSELVAPAGAARGAATLKLQFKHRSAASGHGSATRGPRKVAVPDAPQRDLHRNERITVEKYQNAQSRFAAQQHRRRRSRRPTAPPGIAGKLVTTVESWASVGYGEFLADVFVGTPPRRLSLVVDTGSDLSWVQCLPCYDCFQQRGSLYDPALSSSYRPVPCADPRCHEVVPPPDNPPQPCRSIDQPCRYLYWYGEGEANTTGDLAREAFTFGLNDAGGGAALPVEDVIFGCGHRNRGLFQGTAGLLGLGRGPLSFSSQLRPLYGGVFSYCLVDWHADLSVSGKLVFGEDRELMARPDLNFTSFVAGAVDTYYYVRVKGIKVAGELLDIPPETWELSQDGLGGAIVDSGTTLSRFAAPAHRAIRDAWTNKMKDYPVAAAEDFPMPSACYDISGAGNVSLPNFAILFADGAVWTFPPENFSIRPRKAEEVVCLAVLGDLPSTLSMILGNYQQQNFHVVYDAGRSRLGFAPERCADL